jgi:uncharacterized protein (DUF58 family)
MPFAALRWYNAGWSVNSRSLVWFLLEPCMARSRQIWLCREGLYYTVIVVAVLSGAVSRQLNLLMLLGSALAGPLIFSLLHGRLALRWLHIERKLPPGAQAGMPVRVEVNATNQRRWLSAWAIRVEDVIRRDDAQEDEANRVSVYFPRIAANETRQMSYEGTLSRRGRYVFGELSVSTRFPLGLVLHRHVLAGQAELLVQPRLGRLTSDFSKIMREHESGSHRRQRRGLLEADFYGLREWRPGDSRRWIHWRSSARSGSLVVRQFEQRRSQNLAILVDLWQPSTPNEKDLAHVETAISFAATLIAEACRMPGCQVTLVLAAQQPLHRSGPATPLFLREQMETLATVQPHTQPAQSGELGQSLAVIEPSTPTFFLSTRPIDFLELARQAAQRNAQLSGRPLQGICVAGPELSRFYHA